MALIRLSGIKKKRKYFFFNWQITFHSWGISRISFFCLLKYFLCSWLYDWALVIRNSFIFETLICIKQRSRKKSLIGDRKELQTFKLKMQICYLNALQWMFGITPKCPCKGYWHFMVSLPLSSSLCRSFSGSQVWDAVQQGASLKSLSGGHWWIGALVLSAKPLFLLCSI